MKTIGYKASGWIIIYFIVLIIGIFGLIAGLSIGFDGEGAYITFMSAIAIVVSIVLLIILLSTPRNLIVQLNDKELKIYDNVIKLDEIVDVTYKCDRSRNWSRYTSGTVIIKTKGNVYAVRHVSDCEAVSFHIKELVRTKTIAK
jgi:hypothetical protein